MRRLLLRSFQSPGDILMLTAAVRDLHRAQPGQYQTDVRTAAPALWENNPHLTALQEGQSGVEAVDMHYPLIHQSNQRPYHFIHGYVQYLEELLGLRIPVTRFQGDIYLTPAEKAAPPPGAAAGVGERFWIIVAGGKYDFTAKWWNPDHYQRVVDHFRGRIRFVQCGEAGHWHPRLNHVIDLVGKTTLRALVRLMYHADGVVCPVTFAMHLAAAVETRPGRPKNRACVVVAGGREPAQWEAYPHHQFLSTNGALPCCADGGCWKSRCQTVGDGDEKDHRDLCERPVQLRPDLRIPQCMHMITPEDVIRQIDLYYQGGALTFTNITPDATAIPHKNGTAKVPAPTEARPSTSVLIEFRHGLGDAAQLTVVLKHLKHYHPDWALDVAALLGKHSAYRGLCRRVFVLDREPIYRSAYQQVYTLDWHESRSSHAEWPSTKPIRCLQEVFQLTPIPDLCSYGINPSEQAVAAARRYLASVCGAKTNEAGRYPAVLIHYQGNTSSDRKDLPHDVAQELCATIARCGQVPIILDWDRRSPLIDGQRVFNPGADHELWGGIGTGDAEMLAALVEAAALMIGIDSGPLHVAGATTTPTLGVWTAHHPVHFFDLCPNVIHLVPGDHEKYAYGKAALDHFTKKYRHRTYKQLAIDLPAYVESLLTGADVEDLINQRFLNQLSTTVYGERYYSEHRAAGLDYLGFGDWQRQYGRWLVDSLSLKGKRLLDVGCACGSILRGLGEAGAIVQGVDVNEYMIQLGREKWPDMARLMFICDAVNLHLFGDGSWDAVHSAQVAEHWKPELVPFILKELRRIVTPGGLFFCCLDTEELFARQGRQLATEDPTHICIHPMSWWHGQLTAAGWEVCSTEFAPALLAHSESFLKRYDWDWFIARSR